MIYGTWVADEIARYASELEMLEREEPDKESALYLQRRASIVQCMKLLEELAEPVESDPA